MFLELLSEDMTEEESEVTQRLINFADVCIISLADENGIYGIALEMRQHHVGHQILRYSNKEKRDKTFFEIKQHLGLPTEAKILKFEETK